MCCIAAKFDPDEIRYYCSVSGDQCMYYIPNSKKCAKDYGKGPDVEEDKMKNENYCATCYYRDFNDLSDTAYTHCVVLIGGIPSEYKSNKDLEVKQVLADLVGGSIDESLHSLTRKLLFGDNKSTVKFEYKDLSEKTSKMSSETFKSLLDELDGNSLETLKEKNARYAKNGDCLHNFRSGAEIMGCTTAQTCWRYMAKHLADLRNKIDANDFSNREDFLEKCQDTINYIRFLWCIGNENRKG